MVVCKKCRYNNNEGVNYCINCGNRLEITKEYLYKVEREKKTATINYLSIFFIGLGSCILFGGFVTWIQFRGTIVEDISTQAATPYIVIGLLLLFIGLIIYGTKPTISENERIYQHTYKKRDKEKTEEYKEKEKPKKEPEYIKRMKETDRKLDELREKRRKEYLESQDYKDKQKELEENTKEQQLIQKEIKEMIKENRLEPSTPKKTRDKPKKVENPFKSDVIKTLKDNDFEITETQVGFGMDLIVVKENIKFGVHMKKQETIDKSDIEWFERGLSMIGTSKVDKGIYITDGNFTQSAMKFADEKEILLMQLSENE